MTPQDARPRFQSRVTLVAVTAVVRKKNGQPVTGLRPDDFELYDNGERRSIAQFQSMASKISVALLLDFSGSMEVGAKMSAAHDAAQNLLNRLEPGSDEAGLFAFDSDLRELQPIEPAPGAILARLDAAKPYGVTSLYDAIAGAGRVLSDRGGPRRAIVALTDGDIFAIFSPATSMAAAGQVVNELRQQYLIAFPPGLTPGWHAIDVRTRQKNLIVRARSGYVVSAAADVH
jgi:VWFA-related protein